MIDCLRVGQGGDTSAEESNEKEKVHNLDLKQLKGRSVGWRGGGHVVKVIKVLEF